MFQLFLWIIYILEKLAYFETKNYKRRLDIIENLCQFCPFFCMTFWIQNVLIPSSPKIIHGGGGGGCANTPNLYTATKYMNWIKTFTKPSLISHSFLGIVYKSFLALVFKSFLPVLSSMRPYHCSLFERKVCLSDVLK